MVGIHRIDVWIIFPFRKSFIEWHRRTKCNSYFADHVETLASYASITNNVRVMMTTVAVFAPQKVDGISVNGSHCSPSAMMFFDIVGKFCDVVIVVLWWRLVFSLTSWFCFKRMCWYWLQLTCFSKQVVSSLSNWRLAFEGYNLEAP